MKKVHFNSFGDSLGRTYANCGKPLAHLESTDLPEEITCQSCRNIASDTAAHRVYDLSHKLAAFVRTIEFKQSDDPNITLVKADQWAQVGILLSKIKEQEDICKKLGRAYL